MNKEEKERIKQHFSKLGKKSWEARKSKILKAPSKKYLKAIATTSKIVDSL